MNQVRKHTLDDEPVDSPVDLPVEYFYFLVVWGKDQAVTEGTGPVLFPIHTPIVDHDCCDLACCRNL